MPPTAPTDHHHDLIRQNAPLVKNIARQLARKLPAHVHYEDLMQDGLLALTDAIVKNQRQAVGSQLQAYIAKRTHGAMLDGLRANDPASRQLRQTMRQVESAIQKLSHERGQPPLESEVAHALNMPLSSYQRMLQEVEGYRLLSLDDLLDENEQHGVRHPHCCNESDPAVVLQRKALRQTLIQAIQALEPQEQHILALYYEENLSMRAIGEELGVSESRISQLHTQIVARLRASLFTDNGKSPLLKPRRQARPAERD